MSTKYYFNTKFCKLLDLDSSSKYSTKYIFNLFILEEFITLSDENKLLFKINHSLLNFILKYKMCGTNNTFYKLFYLMDTKWNNYLRNGMMKPYIYKIIKSMIVEKKKLIKFNYFNKGNAVKKICI